MNEFNQVDQLKGALKEERAKRKLYAGRWSQAKARISFLENLIEEYTRMVKRVSRDEWTSVTPRVRFMVMFRDKFQCQYCGASRQEGAQLVVDHIVPRSDGGKTALQNLRTACMVCNQGKGDMSLELETMVRPSRHPSADLRGKEIGLPDPEGSRPSDKRAVSGSLPENQRRGDMLHGEGSHDREA